MTVSQYCVAIMGLLGVGHVSGLALNDLPNKLYSPRCGQIHTRGRETYTTKLINNHYYVAMYGKLTWWQARDKCLDCGMYLATIANRAELNGIQQWFQHDAKAKSWLNRGGYTMSVYENSLWVDATDVGHEGVWVKSYPSLSPAANLPWEFYAPDNRGGVEHYAAIYVYEFPNSLNSDKQVGLTDQRDGPHWFMCEYEGQQPRNIPTKCQIIGYGLQ